MIALWGVRIPDTLGGLAWRTLVQQAFVNTEPPAIEAGCGAGHGRGQPSGSGGGSRAGDDGIGSPILRDPRLTKQRIMTNSPRKICGVGRIRPAGGGRGADPHPAGMHNAAYLSTKRVELGYTL